MGRKGCFFARRDAVAGGCDAVLGGRGACGAGAADARRRRSVDRGDGRERPNVLRVQQEQRQRQPEDHVAVSGSEPAAGVAGAAASRCGGGRRGRRIAQTLFEYVHPFIRPTFRFRSSMLGLTLGGKRNTAGILLIQLHSPILYTISSSMQGYHDILLLLLQTTSVPPASIPPPLPKLKSPPGNLSHS